MKRVAKLLVALSRHTVPTRTNLFGRPRGLKQNEDMKTVEGCNHQLTIIQTQFNAQTHVLMTISVPLQAPVNSNAVHTHCELWLLCGISEQYGGET
jgi:hypothetical protein